jgi:hypothetical protein
MDKPILSDYEEVEDITGTLSLLRNIEEKEQKVKENKPLKEYGRITCSEY